MINKIIDKIVGIKGDITCVYFLENGNRYKYYIHEDVILSIVKDILILGEYERLDNFKLSNFKGGTILDAGAHVGTFSIMASAYGKEIISIEPHPLNFKLFETNISMNNIKNILPLNVALWVNDDYINLYTSIDSTAHTLIKKTDEKFSVKCVQLSNIVRNYDRIDLLKLDIEGAEYDVLINTPDDVFDKISNIVMEFHLYDTKEISNIDVIIKKLEKNGYDIKIFDAPLFDWRYSIKRIINIRKIKVRPKLKLMILLSCIGINTIILSKFFKFYDDNKFVYAFRKTLKEK